MASSSPVEGVIPTRRVMIRKIIPLDFRSDKADAKESLTSVLNPATPSSEAGMPAGGTPELSSVKPSQRSNPTNLFLDGGRKDVPPKADGNARGGFDMLSESDLMLLASSFSESKAAVPTPPAAPEATDSGSSSSAVASPRNPESVLREIISPAPPPVAATSYEQFLLRATQSDPIMTKGVHWRTADADRIVGARRRQRPSPAHSAAQPTTARTGPPTAHTGPLSEALVLQRAVRRDASHPNSAVHLHTALPPPLADERADKDSLHRLWEDAVRTASLSSSASLADLPALPALPGLPDSSASDSGATASGDPFGILTESEDGAAVRLTPLDPNHPWMRGQQRTPTLAHAHIPTAPARSLLQGSTAGHSGPGTQSAPSHTQTPLSHTQSTPGIATPRSPIVAQSPHADTAEHEDRVPMLRGSARRAQELGLTVDEAAVTLPRAHTHRQLRRRTPQGILHLSRYSHAHPQDTDCESSSSATASYVAASASGAETDTETADLLSYELDPVTHAGRGDPGIHRISWADLSPSGINLFTPPLPTQPMPLYDTQRMIRERRPRVGGRQAAAAHRKTPPSFAPSGGQLGAPHSDLVSRLGGEAHQPMLLGSEGGSGQDTREQNFAHLYSKFGWVVVPNVGQPLQDYNVYSAQVEGRTGPTTQPAANTSLEAVLSADDLSLMAADLGLGGSPGSAGSQDVDSGAQSDTAFPQYRSGVHMSLRVEESPLLPPAYTHPLGNVEGVADARTSSHALSQSHSAGSQSLTHTRTQQYTPSVSQLSSDEEMSRVSRCTSDEEFSVTSREPSAVQGSVDVPVSPDTYDEWSSEASVERSRSHVANVYDLSEVDSDSDDFLAGPYFALS